ncbi:hypothetical protein DCAR_0311485 [Daucus carota subsp. sativus]|uniref:COBRA-like protein n=1 Tax=Daucus carota subsp. sativus TaxID=79200 RepID=A0AAF1AT96_DAUCS|nr:PREDICTED: COBRA-like protein 4 [Daucus carota subsp. sativus]WOG92222.1 hypothetical protein DCAR_0311485 [Daucus carota subsp. sativus]
MNSFRFLPPILLVVYFVGLCSSVGAYDPLDPNGEIKIKWDLVSWTPDGYIAMVTMINAQMYRHITTPGWTLGWTWASNEVIWSVLGAQATDQGNCSRFHNNTPHSCMKNPYIIDLLPGAPYNQQVTSCCRGGILASQGQDAASAVSAFQINVGNAGKTDSTVKMPKNFTLFTPGSGYTCSSAAIVPPTFALTPDGRRKTRAMISWEISCTYSQMLASRNPTCCVSLSSFYSYEVTPCSACACGCEKINNCIMENDSRIQSAPENSTQINDNALVQCTHHMCPIRVHWHVKTNYDKYWRVKISITNFNYGAKYKQWTLVAQHPNFKNVAQVHRFGYKPLNPYPSTNDIGMFYGVKHYQNEILLEAGSDGNVHSELIFEKDKEIFTLNQGWTFPRKIYFNGDECTMPLPDSYPKLPKSVYTNLHISLPKLFILVLIVLLALRFILCRNSSQMYQGI